MAFEGKNIRVKIIINEKIIAQANSFNQFLYKLSVTNKSMDLQVRINYFIRMCGTI